MFEADLTNNVFWSDRTPIAL